MIGAVVGDLVGSRFGRNKESGKEFEFLTYKCFLTDRSVMTLALAQAILVSKSDHSDLRINAAEYIRRIGSRHSRFGTGEERYNRIQAERSKPYNSGESAAAVRVSAAGFAASDLDEARQMAGVITDITHSHPEGIKGAEAVAAAIYMARAGSSILEIRDYIDKKYYPMNFTLDGIRDTYEFSNTCQNTVPQALMAFLESRGFEDAVRNAVSIGGDSGTIAAITGGVAEAYYGVPARVRKHALTFLDEELLGIVIAFENKYSPFMEKKVGEEICVPVIRKSARRVKETGGKGEMIKSAMDIADADVRDSELNAEETTSKKLFNHLFEACNILRGPINQDEFKSYVTPILFFKRISDVYEEEYAEALYFSGGDREYAEAEEMHSFIIPAGCHWEDVRAVGTNVGKAIVNAMAGIEKANSDTLAGVFSSFDDATWTDKNKLDDQRLKNLIEHMSLVKVGNQNYPADIMGDSYEYLIKKFADMSKKNAGEFYTPRTIVKLMVKLLDPRAGDTVYDPACGTGGMLIEAIRHIRNDQMTYGRIFGQENNLSTSAIARMNLYLHGAKDVQIRKGDTLRDPLFLEKGKLKTFDCVLANPPFGMKKWGALPFENDRYGRNIWGCPNDSRADFAWLQHMIKSMDSKKGRCAVVLPQGVLFHGGKEGEIREQLIKSDKIEAVITLASGVFYSTGVSACIVFLKNKKQHNHIGRVCLIDGTEVYTAQRAQNEISLKDMEVLLKYYEEYRDVTERVKIVSIEDLEKGGFDLSVKKYIEKRERETLSPALVRDKYFAALEEVRVAEEKVQRLLIEGGFVHE